MKKTRSGIGPKTKGARRMQARAGERLVKRDYGSMKISELFRRANIDLWVNP